MESILLENIDVNSKHKKIRNFFILSFENIKKEKCKIAIYDYSSINFCDLPKVKESIELQGKNEKKPIDFLRQEREKERSYFGEFTAIYLNNKKENKSFIHLKECFDNLLNLNEIARIKKRPNLETATQSVLSLFNKLTTTTLKEHNQYNERGAKLENNENDIIFSFTNCAAKSSSSVTILTNKKSYEQSSRRSKSRLFIIFFFIYLNTLKLFNLNFSIRKDYFKFI